MGNPRKTKDKKNKEPASKTRETPRREEGTTARAGEAEEPSTSNVQDAPVNAGVSGDDDGSTQQLSSRSQTNRTSRSQTSTADTQCFTT